MMRALSCAVDGCVVGCGGIVDVVPDEEETNRSLLLVLVDEDFCASLVLEDLGAAAAAAAFLVVERGDLGDDVGGNSGFTSGIG
jgi:hypothetical protein